MMRWKAKYQLMSLFVGAGMVVAGCTGTPAVPGTSPAVSSTSSGSSSSTASGQVDPSGQPTLSTEPAATSEPSLTPTTASLTLFYIAPNDAGTSGPLVGCGDSAVAVTSSPVTYTDPVEGALRTLLAEKAQQIGQSGLQNTLYNTNLIVELVERSGGAVTAHLTGTLSLGGVCDIPRVKQQLLLTAKSAAGVTVAITINGKTLSEALSLK